LLLPNQNRGFDGLISFVYCFGCEPENPSSYLFDCAILAPTNEVVAVINKKMIQQLAYGEMSHSSSDAIDDSSCWPSKKWVMTRSSSRNRRSLSMASAAKEPSPLE
jgi:hypothetical protein